MLHIPRLEFVAHGQQISLPVGGRHQLARDQNYRDAPAATVSALNARIRSGVPWRDAVDTEFAQTQPWLHRIISHPSRALFLEQYPLPARSWILDVGAGWGQWALPLAVSATVCALEPTPERLDFIQAAAEQERRADRMFFLQTDYLAVDFTTQFDAACCIGVLEWVGSFSRDKDPHQTQLAFLRKLRRDVKTGGSVILGIENRLGLKYLLGCPDDHTGVADISVYDHILARRKWQDHTNQELRVFTFTRFELTELLQLAGFRHIEFFAAFPDYKTPEFIIPLGGATETRLLTGSGVIEHDGSNGSLLPQAKQEELQSHYQSLARLGIASNFVPSFYVLAR